MQCTVKWRSYFIRSLSFHVVDGLVLKDDTTLEFSVKDFRDNPNIKKSGELRSMIFRGVTHILTTKKYKKINAY